MAEAFGTGAGIVGVISLAIQITQAAVQFGVGWKDAPENVKAFLVELGTLKTVLSETNTNILLNPDFANAFQDRPSLLLSQLGPSAPSTTSTKLMIETCRKELESLLKELEKRKQGHRLGWERLKGAFLAKETRDSVEQLCRQCQTLNNMLSIDSVVLGANTYREVRDARKEQQEWHQAETKNSSAIKVCVDQSLRWQEKQEYQTVLDWLTPVDYVSQQSDFISRRQVETGQWLLDSAEFQAWLKAETQTLFCPGIPGAGKTILTSVVVDYLYNKFQKDPNIGIAYIYCNFRRQHEQKPEGLIASLLKQLVQQQSSLPDIVKTLYDQHKEKRTQPSLDEILKVLHYIINSYSIVYVVIDALDECQLSDGYRSKFLSNIFNLQANTRAQLFATSRPIADIEREFKGCLSREIVASDEDVRRYLDGHMLRLPAFVMSRPILKEEIKTGIVSAVEGMFLLAQLYLDSLEDKTTAKAIKIALQHLQKHPRGFGESTKLTVLSLAYDEAIERINRQKKGFQLLAMKVLSWITCTERPLTVRELQEAIAVEDGDTEIDKDNLSQIEDMVSVCAGLVTVDKESNIIRLVHYTTQEFFERTQMSLFPDAHTDIAKSCITYLAFTHFETGFCPTGKEFEARLQANMFYDYAAQNWGYHAYRASKAVEEPVLNFLSKKANLSACTQAMLVSGSPQYRLKYSQDFPKDMTGVHVVAYFGLEKVMKALFESGAELEATDERGQTPLLWAAMRGHVAVLQLLLDKGAILEAMDKIGRTSLLWAASNGHKAVVQLLLDKGAMLETTDKHGQTPLSWAASNGHEAVVQLLLDKGAMLVTTDKYGQTPLSWAASNGHKAVVQLLLDKGAMLETTDKHGQTPLSWAASNGHIAVIQLLLDKGAMLETIDIYGRTSLLWAASNGHKAVVQLLLDKGAMLETTDKHGQTPLSLAAGNRSEEVVELLLAMDSVNPNTNDKMGRTPLFYAARGGHRIVVKLLLKNEVVDPDSRDHYGSTPLSIAARYGFDAVVELLLAKDGIDFCSTDKLGGNPLFWATKNGHSNTVQLLIEKYRVIGTIVPTYDLPVTTALAAPGESRINCDVCLLNIPDAGNHHHCQICHAGDFDICYDCVTVGAHCLDLLHKLVRRTVRDGAYVYLSD